MRRWLNYISAFSLCILSLLSCSSEIDTDTITYIAVRCEGSHNLTLIDEQGDTLPGCSFQAYLSDAINGYFTASDISATHVSVYSVDSPRRPVHSLDNLVSAGVVDGHSSVIPIVREGCRISLYSIPDGREYQLQPIDSKEIAEASGYFSCGRMIVMTADSTYGAVDSRGKMTVKLQYDFLCDFNDNKAVARDSLGHVVIDTDGKEIIRLSKDIVPAYPYRVIDDLLSVKKGDKIGFINMKGDFRSVPEEVKSIHDYNKRFFVYSTTDDKYGVMDFNMHTLLPGVYNDITRIYRDNWFIAEDSDGQWAVINRKGHREVTFDDAIHVSSPRWGPYDSSIKFLVQTDRYTYHIYDEHGSPLGPAFFPTGRVPQLRSDWFDVSGAIADLLNPLKTDGYELAKLNGIIGQLTTSQPQNYVNKYQLQFYHVDGNQYDIQATAHSYHPVAKWETTYEERDIFFTKIKIPNGQECIFNEDANISSISIELTSDTRSWKTLKPQIQKTLPQHGYNIKETTEAYIVATHGDVTLFIGAHNDCCGADLYLSNKTNYSAFAGSLKRNAEINYAQGT